MQDIEHGPTAQGCDVPGRLPLGYQSAYVIEHCIHGLQP